MKLILNFELQFQSYDSTESYYWKCSHRKNKTKQPGELLQKTPGEWLETSVLSSVLDSFA